MATQAYQSDHHRLVKAGLEGFALVDELFGRPKKPANKLPAPQGHDHRYHHHPHHHNNYHHQYQQPYIYWGPQIVTVKEPVMDSYEAAPHHYISHHHTECQQPYIYRSPQTDTVKEPVMDCNKAAQLYGGKLIVEHRIGKPNRNCGYY